MKDVNDVLAVYTEEERKIVVELNTYAGYLRDSADREYIAARLLILNGLSEQFMWSALHAIEKYLKSACLFNKIAVKSYSHVITPLFQELKSKGVICDLDPDELKFCSRLEETGKDRYFLISKWCQQSDLQILDKLVVKIRGYCQNCPYRDPYAKDFFDKINKSASKLEYVNLGGGYIESLLAGSFVSRIQLSSLVKFNRYFFRKRKGRSYTGSLSMSFNPPMSEDRLKILSEYIRIPGVK